MKTFIATMILLAGSIALANTGVRRYSITTSQFAADHLSGPVAGTIELNYDNSTVTLKATETKGVCPPGKACTLNHAINLNPRTLEVTLPIVSIERDACGVYVVTASKDQRPVDGPLKTITVEDASEITCQTFIKYVERATYLTSIYDRFSPVEVTAESTMNLDLVAENERVFSFAKGQLLKGFPSLEIPSNGQLKITKSHVYLNIQMRLNCKFDQACPMYMPGPLMATLPIVQVTPGFCSTEILARNSNTEIRIHDYTASPCEIFYPHLIEVEYHSEIRSDIGTTERIKDAQFSFDVIDTK